MSASRRGLLRAAPALAALLSAASVRAACTDAYRESYKADWNLSAALWSTLCGRGKEPTEILRDAQKESIAACVRTYKAPAEAAGVNASDLRSYCAQGAAGRARAAALTGAVPKDEAKKPDIRPPGSAGMGPAALAFKLAHSRWMEDACWSAMDYSWQPEHIIKKEEYDKQRRLAGYKMKETETHLDSYNYYFASPAKEVEALRIGIYDELDDIFRTAVIRSKGPELKTLAMRPEYSLCLADIKLEPDAAIAAAGKHGLALGGRTPVVAMMRRFPPGYFRTSKCRIQFVSSRKTFPCGDLWDPAETRTLENRSLWAVSADERTVFLDTATGAHLFSGEGSIGESQIWEFIRQDPRMSAGGDNSE